MTVQCIACASFDLRSAGSMAALGMGRCKLDRSDEKKARFQSARWPRECSTYKPASAATVEERVRWFSTKTTGGSQK